MKNERDAGLYRSDNIGNTAFLPRADILQVFQKRVGHSLIAVGSFIYMYLYI